MSELIPQLAQAASDPLLSRAWLVPGLPLAGFLLNGLVIRPLKKEWVGPLATTLVFASMVLSWLLALRYYSFFPAGGAHPALVSWQLPWLQASPDLVFGMGTLLDPASLLLLVVVTTVSAFVHLYSIGYMADDPGKARYFTFLNLFTFSMLGLVLASNMVQLYVCWELVGASSFLLIGFYFSKPSAVAAAKKAFIVTRFADLGLLLGTLLLSWMGWQLLPGLQATGMAAADSMPADFAVLNSAGFHDAVLSLPWTVGGLSLLSLSLLLVFMGAAGKSAMFPLHIWLPDAMEGPTPVSALIHAATMVVAGVYLVARLFPAFAAAGQPLQVVAFVGAFTCLFAALLACRQDDIKRVLAYSTLSQLGYMMFALGVASMEHPLGYTASLFHLFTHAFFKSLLFLGAGAVIHAVHSNSIREMGGLRRKMPLTHLAFLLAVLAIAGLPPFSGFFSKDEILRAALESGHTWVYATGMLVAVLTPFYMARIYLVAFLGEPRSEAAAHAHDAPWTMTVPLLVLAALAVAAGWLPMGQYVSTGAEHAGAHGIDWSIAAPATLASLLGLGLAWWLHGSDPARSAARRDSLFAALGPIGRAIDARFWIDEIWLFVTRKIVFNLVAAPIAWFDRNVVDGAVNLTGWLARIGGAGLTLIQNGQVQAYATWLVSGAVGLGLLLWFLLP